MARPRSFLPIVAALAAAVVVPVAGAGTGDAQAIRAVATQYSAATQTGSPVACQLMTSNGQASFVYFASALTKTKLASCPAAVAALAKLNESQFPSHTAYVNANAATLRSLAHGKVTIHGTRATLSYTVTSGFVHVGGSIEFALVRGHWLVDG